ncbi:hypothetical protein SADUNF_Sadunf02G0198500 [Salix dunnii]|uniref:Uncharacterized protein n=1 Tax=Salix dunnii TaxID=1413687 RepID=A0A835N8U6_9ROSI|nr:hypothetical protein SADUNF_Sadunf02G0198500 [Salix dunnii]
MLKNKIYYFNTYFKNNFHRTFSDTNLRLKSRRHYSGKTTEDLFYRSEVTVHASRWLQSSLHAHANHNSVGAPLSNLFLPFASSASLIISSFLSSQSMASTQVEAEPVKEVTNKSEASPQSCPVIDEKAATTEEPEVVVQDADDEEEEVKNDSDEEQAEEKLEEYSPITGEDEPNTAFDDDVEADDAFGSWDWNSDLPFTQCFESARQAGLLRYSYSEDRDLYVAGDLYENDVVTPAMIVVPRRRAKMRRPRAKEEKREQSWEVTGDVKESPSPPPLSTRPTPKPVDEDLYKISPELLFAKPKKLLDAHLRSLMAVGPLSMAFENSDGLERASKWKGWLTQVEGVANTSMKATENKLTVASKKTCICAPTSHAGSFRCQLHRTSRSTTAQNSEECNSDKESNEDLDFMKMILCRKLSSKKPQLSRFGRAAAADLAVNNAYSNAK